MISCDFCGDDDDKAAFILVNTQKIGRSGAAICGECLLRGTETLAKLIEEKRNNAETTE